MSMWRVSISELIKIFRGALVALKPSLERARIPFERQDAYDDFDEIAAVLFKRIVDSSVKDALVGFEILAPYGTHLESYKGYSFIRGKVPDASEAMMSFIEFEFDKDHNIFAKVAILYENLTVKEFQIRDFQNMSFSLARNENGHINEIDEVEVEL